MALRQPDRNDYANSITDISVDVISIVESSLRNVLTKHVDRLRKGKDCIGAIALFITLVTVMLTADFKNILLDGKIWFGIFLVVTVASFAYLIYVAYNHYKYEDSVDQIIEDIKAERGGASSCMTLSPATQNKSRKTKTQSSGKRTKKK